MLRIDRGTRNALVIAVVVLAVAAMAATGARAADAKAAKATKAPAKRSAASEDSTLTLRGGQEGTVFRSLTVEGEDRIHFEVERPALRLELDPAKAPGLEWGTARDVLDRTIPDTMAPLVAGSARESSPYTAHPWLSHFASGAVAHFRPAVEDVESWKLTVADGRGAPVTVFQGRGKPPKEITWDGRAANGAPVVPGRTYSYVFEAVDRAGNRRNFVGEGFRVSAFRMGDESSPTLVFTAAELDEGAASSNGLRPGARGTMGAQPVLIEAASWLNQGANPSAPITLTATGRTAEEAGTLARRIQSDLSSLLIGDPARIKSETRVESDAPPGGSIALSFSRTTPPAAPPAKR